MPSWFYCNHLRAPRRFQSLRISSRRIFNPTIRTPLRNPSGGLPPQLLGNCTGTGTDEEIKEPFPS